MSSEVEEAASGGKNEKPKKFCHQNIIVASLVGLVCLLAAICAILSVVLFSHSVRSSKVSSTHSTGGHNDALSLQSNCDNVCITEPCVTAAAAILKLMDHKVDPCNNFYDYACGRWKRTYPLPEDKSSYDTFTRLRDDVQIALKGLFEGPITEVDSNITKSVKNLYKSCVNLTLIEARGEEPLKELISTLGGWPMLDTSWNETAADLTQLLAKLKGYSNDVLFTMWVGADSKNSTTNIIQLDQASLSFPSRDYYLQKDEKIMQAYLNYIRNVARLLGTHSILLDLDAQGILAFEMQLANITRPSEDRRDIEALYHKTTVGGLKDIIPQVDWKKYFRTVNPNVTEDEPVVVFGLEYLQDLDNLLSRTSKRVVTNYMMWRFVQNRVTNMDSRFRQVQQNYYSVLLGRQRQPDRWRECVSYVGGHLGMAVGALFVRDNFDNASKEMAEEMIDLIRVSFIELLDEVDWMDPATKKVAHSKALRIGEKVGYPDYILDAEKLDREYGNLEFQPTKYFENVLTNLQRLAKMEQEKLFVPYNKTLWSSNPAVVNAFYNRAKNQITFPAAILQPPFFNKNYPRSLNFGGIGVVIGHEVTHGFDDRGRQFDEDGNLVQWWHDEAIEKFRSKVQCIIEQYGNYTVPEVGMKVNGITTQGENIADNGGVKQAFRAYRKWINQHGEEPLLPGLDLTHDQLFFVSFAQVWCGVMRPEAYISKIRSGPHSPGRFRVIGALSNSLDFADAFHCPVGSEMNPKQKCVVW